MEKTNSWAIIISCVSLVVALACVGFVYCKCKEMGGVIDLGTFVGICVGLIGVCATIILGLQIWNHIEFQVVKSKVNEINAAKEDINSILNKQQETNDDYLERLGIAYMLIGNASPDKSLRCNLILEGIILTSDFHYKQYSKGVKYRSVLELLQTLKNEIDANANYCLDVDRLNKFKNMKFPKKHRDYCDMVSTQMAIIKIIEANNQKATTKCKN